jgi:hypothetical protein
VDDALQRLCPKLSLKFSSFGRGHNRIANFGLSPSLPGRLTSEHAIDPWPQTLVQFVAWKLSVTQQLLRRMVFPESLGGVTALVLYNLLGNPVEMWPVLKILAKIVRDVPATLFLDLAVTISVHFSSCPYPLINLYAACSRP